MADDGAQLRVFEEVPEGDAGTPRTPGAPDSAEPPIGVSVIRGGPAILDSLAAEWDLLFERAHDSWPFASRAWLRAWLEDPRWAPRARAIAAHAGNRLVALLVLTVRRVLSVRTARPLGSPVPSYLGLLADPSMPHAADAVADYVAAQRPFDLLVLEDLSTADTPTLRLVARLARAGYSCHVAHRNLCRWIRIEGQFDEHMRRHKSPKSRETVRRKERRLQRDEALEIERFSSDRITPELLRRIAAIQRDSWMERRGAAQLGDPFYQRLLSNAAAGGLVQLSIAKLKGEDAAFVLALVAHRRLLYAWTAFKLPFERLSVGQVLTAWTVRDACAQGIHAFDFSHGDAEYKRFWSTDSHDVCRVAMGRGLRAEFAAGIRWLLWRAARVGLLKRTYRGVRRLVRRGAAKLRIIPAAPAKN